MSVNFRWLIRSDRCAQLSIVSSVHHSKLITVLVITTTNLVVVRHSEYIYVAKDNLQMFVYLYYLILSSLTCTLSDCNLVCVYPDGNCAVHKCLCFHWSEIEDITCSALVLSVQRT